MHFEKNIALLAKRYPQYALQIQNAPVTGRYHIQPSMKGEAAPNLIDRTLNLSYYNNVDPMYSAELDIINTNTRLPQVGIFLGLGLGYHLAAYTKLFQGRMEHLIIIERDWELLKAALTMINFKGIFTQSSITLCFGSPPVSFYPAVYHALNTGSAKLYLQTLNFINIPAAVKSDMPYYAQCIKTVKDAVQGIFALYGNDPEDSLIGIKNTFRNINTIIDCPGIKDLKGAFKGKPGVVVSTGPSLDKNIHLLKEVGDKAVIAAADASFKVMLKHGVKPHFVTSLERVLPTAKLFEGLTAQEAENTYLSACPVVMPETYANFPGEKIIVYRNFATFEWLNIDKGMLDTGPSAGNMAYNLLAYLGCSVIILIGQDLAYAADKTHAEGSTYGTEQGGDAWLKNSFFVEGNFEPQVRTTPAWELFKKHYEKDIAAFHGKVVNATEGGAKIYGTELMSFREAIDRYITDPVQALSVIHKKLKIPFPAQKEKERQSTRKKVTDAVAYCDSVIGRLKTGAEHIHGALETFYKAYLQGDSQMEAPLAAAYNDSEKYFELFSETKFYQILMHYVQSYFIKSMNELNAIHNAEDPSPELHGKLLAKILQIFVNMMNLTEIMKKELNVMLSLLEEKPVS